MMQIMQKWLNSIFATKRFNLYAIIIITAIILTSYSNTFTAAFHFDDNPSIVENTYIKRLTWDNFLNMFNGTRPVVNLSLMFNYQLSGLHVVGWHIFNIGLHIANSIFVFLLILWTLTMPTVKERFGYRANRMALFGALLFAVHPVQTESVTYIISRTELLAAFFYLATILLFIKGAVQKKSKYYFAAFITAVFAMGSKEWAVTLPAILLLYDAIFLSNRSIKAILVRWQAHAFIALSWGVLIYTMSTTKLTGAGFGVTGQNNITPWTYLLTSCNVIWTYIRILFLPIKQNLDYTYPLAMNLFGLPTFLSVVGHIGVVSASLWALLKKQWILIPFGILWFYITLSPTQSFVPILDVIFEHRVYLPSVGFVIVVVAGFEGISDWIEKKKSFKAAHAISQTS